MSGPGFGLRLRWAAEAALARAVFALFGALGPVRASNFGAAVARAIGPHLPVSRVADRNLAIAFPERDAAWRRETVKAAWDNLGRVVAEYPHLSALKRTDSGPGWEIAGEAVMREIAGRGGPAIFFSGHIANWELLPPAASHFGIVLSSVYRAPANPLIDHMILGFREAALAPLNAPLFPKGARGARAMLAHFNRGGFLAMLLDQKMNDGIEARLFGRPAMTAPALAQLALRHRCPVIPGRAMRVGPARYRFETEPPLPLPDSGNRAADVAALTQAVNDTLERWIRDRPAEWLLFHRRFDKALYRKG
ncbi:MAG: lauroyl acyltransferase [Acetobacteraceae bacterium]|jgi:KDO2-lipid IV(A) lauroyltransferase|nr:lauroyl acyltransferase [Acetobacteraceae bacterium]